MTLLLQASLTTLWLALFPTEAPKCEPVGPMRITGYSVTHFPGHTYDGTSTTDAIRRGEHIVAASWNIPIETKLRIKGLDYLYRVADRGMLGNAGWIDVLVKDVETAYKIEEWIGGSHANVCVEAWGR